MTVANTKQLIVRGWFDDQSVALPTTGAPHGIRPRIAASIVPSPQLGSYTIGRFERSWQVVAFVYVRDTTLLTPKYAKWGFKLGWNWLWLRKDPAKPRDEGWQIAVTWSATLPTSAIDALKVVRTDHSDRVVPATARWAWFDDDEGTWVDCAAGCCQAQ